MSLDMSDAFDPDFMTALTLTRYDTGSYVDSEYIAGPTTNPDIEAVIAQPTADELQVLPEGLRTKESKKLHSLSEMLGVSEVGQKLADTFTYLGKPWRIYHVWDQQVGQYYKALAIRDNA